MRGNRRRRRRKRVGEGPLHFQQLVHLGARGDPNNSNRHHQSAGFVSLSDHNHPPFGQNSLQQSCFLSRPIRRNEHEEQHITLFPAQGTVPHSRETGPERVDGGGGGGVAVEVDDAEGVLEGKCVQPIEVAGREALEEGGKWHWQRVVG